MLWVFYEKFRANAYTTFIACITFDFITLITGIDVFVNRLQGFMDIIFGINRLDGHYFETKEVRNS